MDDIVPDLLKSIENQFEDRTANSKKIKKSLKLLKDEKATYLDANDFAIEVGEILTDVLSKNITASSLPDGKMYFNIANRVLNSTLKNNFELVSGYTSDVQKLLNQEAGLGLTVQSPTLNQDRIDGLINRISSEEIFSDVKWLLDDPIVNFSQSVVDDSIKANADFHAKAGLSPVLVRRVFGKACDWCQNLAGSYNYNDAPKDIYRRHRRCRCTVDYRPGDGRRQDVWSKQWSDSERDAKIELRKQIGIRNNYDYLPFTMETIGDRKRVTETIRRTKQVLSDYKAETGIDILELWKNKGLIDKENPYSDEKAKFIEYLMEKAGINGLPTHSSDTSGLTAIYRGIGDFKDGTMTTSEQMEALNSGKLLISGSRSSAHGRGIYFSVSDQKAQEYASKGINGQVYKYYLADDIKIFGSDVWKEERSWFKENYQDYPDAEFYQFILSRNNMMDSNVDVLALLTGHDAYQAGHVRTIFNRGKLVISSD
ncbi:hypothetical protein [Enterococcus asini]|uniref:hypothetical protein n=1 Tax=Enterococcus asini TaxID=57732 RepID=UPI0022E4DA12|nr:hypothetical protein [Enterococcus asini]